MEYHGKLYGKMGRHLIPLTLTSEDVDRMQLAIQDRERQIEETESQRDQYAALLCEAMRVVYETTCLGDSTDLIDRFESLELTPSLSSENAGVLAHADEKTL